MKVTFKETKGAILDTRSIWQIINVDGTPVESMTGEEFWTYKNKMVIAALGLNMEASEYRNQIFSNACPLCSLFMTFVFGNCSSCPLDWSFLPKSLRPYNKGISLNKYKYKCGWPESPYRKWKGATTHELSRYYSDKIVELCEKWLDQNKVKYEK
jgi:hypothetical protein